MSVSGLCQVCEDGRARHSCSQCGSLVCRQHYDETEGLCSRCARLGGGRRM